MFFKLSTFELERGDWTNSYMYIKNAINLEILTSEAILDHNHLS
jgi:hypothetical protein